MPSPSTFSAPMHEEGELKWVAGAGKAEVGLQAGPLHLRSDDQLRMPSRAI
jgi:hypothetical protein